MDATCLHLPLAVSNVRLKGLRKTCRKLIFPARFSLRCWHSRVCGHLHLSFIAFANLSAERTTPRLWQPGHFHLTKLTKAFIPRSLKSAVSIRRRRADVTLQARYPNPPQPNQCRALPGKAPRDGVCLLQTMTPPPQHPPHHYSASRACSPSLAITRARLNAQSSHG